MEITYSLSPLKVSGSANKNYPAEKYDLTKQMVDGPSVSENPIYKEADMFYGPNGKSSVKLIQPGFLMDVFA